MFDDIYNWIIIAAALVVAITNILKPIMSATTWGKKKEAERIEKIVNELYTTMLKEHFDAMNLGMQNVLRANILEFYDAHCDDKIITMAEKQTLDQEFDAYIKLGGNGTIKELKEEVMDKWKVII